MLKHKRLILYTYRKVKRSSASKTPVRSSGQRHLSYAHDDAPSGARVEVYKNASTSNIQLSIIQLTILAPCGQTAASRPFVGVQTRALQTISASVRSHFTSIIISY